VLDPSLSGAKQTPKTDSTVSRSASLQAEPSNSTCPADSLLSSNLFAPNHLYRRSHHHQPLQPPCRSPPLSLAELFREVIRIACNSSIRVRIQFNSISFDFGSISLASSRSRSQSCSCSTGSFASYSSTCSQSFLISFNSPSSPSFVITNTCFLNSVTKRLMTLLVLLQFLHLFVRLRLSFRRLSYFVRVSPSPMTHSRCHGDRFLVSVNHCRTLFPSSPSRSTRLDCSS
jgi:hypothetical protein